jgi:hypothetical protein
MLFKPVAIAALFAGALLYTRRFFPRRDDRRLALVLALFACSPVAALVGWANLGSEFRQFQFDLITGELWTGSYLWGYLFTGISVGDHAARALGVRGARGVRRQASGAVVLAALAGLFAGWLQPWQGATFAGILLVGEAVLWWFVRSRPPVFRLAIVLVATAAPLVYYALLSRLDDAWKLAGTANAASAFGGRAWLAVVFGVAIFAIPAAFAYRRVPREFGALALRAVAAGRAGGLRAAARHVPVPTPSRASRCRWWSSGSWPGAGTSAVGRWRCGRRWRWRPCSSSPAPPIGSTTCARRSR